MRTRLGLLLAVVLLVMTGCSSDDGGADEDATVVTVWAANPLKRAMPDVVSTYESEVDGVRLEVTVAPSAELAEKLAAGEKPDVYIDTATRVREIAGDDTALLPREIGQDMVVLVVPKGNPGNVEGLAVFGDPAVPTGLCVETTPCGIAARDLLADAGITPTPTLVGEGWLPVLEATIAGEVDASLLNRTEYISKIRQVDVVPILAQRKVPYEAMVLTGSLDGESFIDWMVESDAANELLKTRGLRDLLQPDEDDAAEEDGTSTTGGSQ